MEELQRTPDAEENIVTLVDEDGQEISFELLDIIDYEDKDYAVMLPAGSEGHVQVIVLEIEEDEQGDPGGFLSVTDDAILDAVYDIFKERYRECVTFEE